MSIEAQPVSLPLQETRQKVVTRSADKSIARRTTLKKRVQGLVLALGIALPSAAMVEGCSNPYPTVAFSELAAHPDKYTGGNGGSESVEVTVPGVSVRTLKINTHDEQGVYNPYFPPPPLGLMEALTTYTTETITAEVYATDNPQGPHMTLIEEKKVVKGSPIQSQLSQTVGEVRTYRALSGYDIEDDSSQGDSNKHSYHIKLSQVTPPILQK